MGTGSLALNFSNATCGGAKKTISPAAQLSPIRQQLVGYLYVPAGATDVTARFYVKDRLAALVNGTSFTGFPANAWNRIHWIDAPVDPSNPPTEIGVDVSRATAYTGTLYFDQLFMRGVTYQQKDALAAHNVIAEYSYSPTTHVTTVKKPDQDGVLRSKTYSYNQWGWLISEIEGDGFDTFDRADGLLTAASSPSGHSWTAESGSSVKIESNIIRQDNGALNKVAYIDAGAAVGGNVSLTAQVVGSDQFIGFATRVIDTNNYLYIKPTRDNGVTLYKKVSGTVTQLASGS